MMLQGKALEGILAEGSHRNSAVSPAGDATQQPRLEPPALERSVRDVLRHTVGELPDDSLSHVSVQGTKRKHIKIVFSSGIERTRILTMLKRARPSNLYANEYLTRIRSSLLYKIRSLKKQYSNIHSAYSKNGTIYYKIGMDDRPTIVTNDSEINKLEEKIINSCA